MVKISREYLQNIFVMDANKVVVWKLSITLYI